MTAPANRSNSSSRLAPPVEVNDRRTSIVEGAVETFARLGFAGASLREIAAASGMEKGHLTYYFRTKQALLFEIVDDLHRRFVVGIDRWAREDLIGDELLLHVFQSHISLVIESLAVTRVAYDNFRFLSGRPRAVVVRKRIQYEKRLGALIEMSRASATIDPAPTELLTLSVLGQLNWPYQWYSPTGQLVPDEAAQWLAERALASLRPLALKGRRR